MRKETDETASYTMLQVATWIRGTILQGERVLAIQSSQSSARRFDRTATVIEEEFFVLSARKLVLWVDEAERQQLIPANTFEQLRELKSIIVDVRNMREHADEYIVHKKGRKQSEFHFAPKDSSGGVAYSSDATATMILDGNYLIGGRLSVQAVLAAAGRGRNAFLPIVSNDQRFRWIASTVV